MTRERMYGSDTEFCDWMRNCKRLPSFSRDFGLSASDNDVTLHRYITAIDGQGTREVQALMQVEVKTRQGKPPFAQIDTLSKLNMFCGQKSTREGVVRFFGVFILVLQNTRPDNSEKMWWGSIPKGLNIRDARECKWKQIDVDVLIDILRFDRHPRSLDKNPFRRHHKTQEVIESEVTPLGFEIEKRVTKRS